MNNSDVINSAVSIADQQFALVGRQSIYKLDLDIFGYELLYRAAPGQNCAPSDFDGNHATTQVMLNAFFELGLSNVVADKQAFINLTDSFISGEIHIPLSRKNIVLEVLESVEPTPGVIAGLKKLKKKGYVIALDDFDFNERALPLLKFADIVKVDMMLLDYQTLEEKIGLLQTQYKPLLLAEKIESMADFEFCKSLGFDLFQGFFLQKPVIIQGKKIPANKLAVLQLLQRLQDPEIDMDELQSLIKHDVSLTYKLLRYINSPAFGLSTEIVSIKQAVLLLGLNVLRRWISLIVMAGLSDKSQDLIRIALIRAKMCDSLAVAFDLDKTEDYFLLGLFSLLDAMLDQPIEQVLSPIPLNADLKDALISGSGKMGDMLKNVKLYEKGDWDALLISPEEALVYKAQYIESIGWAESTLFGLD